MKLHEQFTYIPPGFDPPTDLRCRTCRITKPVAAFYQRLDKPIWSKARWHLDCIECVRRAVREKYHAEDGAATRKKNRKARKQRLASQYITGIATSPMSGEELWQRRWPKMRRAHLLAWDRYSMPKRSVKSFSQIASENRIRRSMQAWLIRDEPPLGDAPNDHCNAIRSEEQLAEQCDALWGDESLSMGERQAKVSALRKRYQD